jgi:hypothetical protein
VTAEEMEAEIISLREQVLQLQQQQEGQKKIWLWISRISAGFVIALAVAGALVTFNSTGGSPPIVFVINGMFLLLLFLTLAFHSVARPTNIGMNTHLRNFALWVIIVLLVLALFTLFQFRAQFWF